MEAERRQVLPFLILVFVLSIPFWLLGSIFEVVLLPGLPIGAFAVFTPGIAASVWCIEEVDSQPSGASCADHWMPTVSKANGGTFSLCFSIRLSPSFHFWPCVQLGLLYPTPCH